MLLFVFIGIICVAFVLYDLLPNYYARNKILWVTKELPLQTSKKVIALTFDDGPDKRYTGQLLDLLKTYGVKATFFIVVKNAQKSPELIQRMIEEGHDLAMHAYQHKSAWLSFPWETKNEFQRSLEFFRSIDRKVYSFRPPWGTFNAVSLKHAIYHGLEVVLWTVEAFDWKKNRTPEEIAQEIIGRIKPNGIIVLHDSGGAEGAPQHTLDALKICLPILLGQGYQFVTIREGMNQDDQHKNIIG